MKKIDDDGVDYNAYRYKSFEWHEEGRANLPEKHRNVNAVKAASEKAPKQKKIKAPHSDRIKPDGQGVFVVLTVTISFLLTFFLAEFFGNGNASKLFSKKSEDIFAAYYAVTVSTFDNESAAAASAVELRNLGGAGFLINDGKYRLIAGVYKTAEEAETVVARMGGYSAEVYQIKINSPELNWCKTSDKELVENVLTYAETVFDKLYNISVDFDKSNISASQAISRIKALYTEINKLTATLDNISVKADTIQLIRLRAETAAVTAMLKNLTDGGLSGYDLLADIRYTLAAVVWGCKNLTVNI